MRYLKKLIILTFSLFFSLQADAPAKKKLLILCSNGGHCHNSAAQTLKTIMGSTYDFDVVYPIDDLRIWGVKSGEQLYNFMLQKGWIQSTNLVSKHVAPKVFRTKKSDIETIVKQYIAHSHPHLIISLIPFINFPASEAARQSGIPYLLITLDNDLQNWVHGLQGVQHPHFKVTVGSDLSSSRGMLRKRHIPDQAITTTGFPIRSDFLATKDFSSLKRDFNIPQNKPVVLMISGGSGGGQLLDYTRRIGSSFLGAHLIACTGENKKLASRLRKVALHPTNSLTVMEFTNQIADLMAISDLLITKPGPGTMNEAMTMQLPILAVGTAPILSWERANIDLIRKYQIGECIENFDHLEPLLRQFLFDSEFRKELKDAYRKIPPNSFQESIGPLIDSMCLLRSNL